jgi:hypothetical protein
VRPQIPLGQTFTLREDTKVGITIGGLMYVPEASEDIRRFVLAGRATWAARRSLPTFDARSAGTAVGD